MYERIFDIENRLDEGMFLFGARQVGKSIDKSLWQKDILKCKTVLEERSHLLISEPRDSAADASDYPQYMHGILYQRKRQIAFAAEKSVNHQHSLAEEHGAPAAFESGCDLAQVSRLDNMLEAQIVDTSI